jgi:8-oxo-dGTP diphosphatase
MAIANSPLVKTAIAGEDANWGRVVAAVGKSGAKADRDRLTIRFGDMVLAENGWRAPSYDEEKASAYMKRDRAGDRRRSGPGQGRAHGLDLRSDPSLYRHQRRLPLMKIVLVAAVALIDKDGRVPSGAAPRGQVPGGPVGISRRQGRAGRIARNRADPRIARGAGDRDLASCLAPLTFASHAYDDFHLLMPLFACRRWQGIPHPREGQRLAWVRAADLGDYPMPPADIPLIPVLRDWL